MKKGIGCVSLIALLMPGLGIADVIRTNRFSSFVTGPVGNQITTYVISAPNELSLIPGDAISPFNIVINNGWTYSMSELDTMSANVQQIKIDFDINDGGMIPLVVLDADTLFDGVFNPAIVVTDNTQIRLRTDFMTNVSGDTVIEFAGLTIVNQDIGVFAEGDESNMSAYEIGTCPGGIGRCVLGAVSNTYSTAQQNENIAAKVLRESVQYNPKKLLSPMIAISQHNMLDYYEFFDETFVSVESKYYNGQHFGNYGIGLNTGTKISGRLNLGVNLYISKTNFKNAVSDFQSDIYDGNLRFNYQLDDTLFVRGVAGFNFSDINCDGVRDGNTTVNNPNAFGFYGGIDFGAKIDFESGLFVSPFIGYDSHYARVVDTNSRGSFMRLGNDVGLKYHMDGMSYNYSLRTGINTNGNFDIGVGFGVWLIADKVGGTVSFSVLDSDSGFSGKLSGNVKLTF